MLNLRERFDEKWTPEPNTGCWLWTASTNRGGYGLLGRRGASSLAHRVAWEVYRGLVPSGLFLDHICRVRCCVNPDHLRLVTKQQNALENSVSLVVAHAKKAVCPKCGGPYSLVTNSRMASGKQRTCLPCHRIYFRAWVAKRKAAGWKENGNGWTQPSQ